jgi:hypothetical protein
MPSKVRHILSLSGGKDSAALAVYMSNRQMWRDYFGLRGLGEVEPIELEYLFMDTGKELPETYEYLHKLQAYLGKPIKRVTAPLDFDFYLKGDYFSMLPSAQMRWCTRIMKLRPFEEECGSDTVMSYIGIRADEDRDGYISHKPNIKPFYPFKEDGIVRKDVFQMLEVAGLGLPGYYDKISLSSEDGQNVEVGRSRSGCTFCFFQQKVEWLWLLEKHPAAYEEALLIERNKENGYTWSQGETLHQLKERKAEIISDYLKRKERLARTTKSNTKLIDLVEDSDMQEESEASCAICQL